MEVQSHSRRVPLNKRKRTEISCDKCKSRKQKCTRNPAKERCSYCELRGFSCTTTQSRKTRIYGSADSLAGRLLLLETLVRGLVPEADLSSNEEMKTLGKMLGIPLPDVDGTAREATPFTARPEEYSLPLVPDQQGQTQYIGPFSSFSFHLHLRRLIGNSPACEFAMFGRNAADQDETPDSALLKTIDGSEQRSGTKSENERDSPSNSVREMDASTIETLVDSYFDIIHPDFPVLHEASFREAHETWTTSTSKTDPSWLCCFLCLLILSRRVTPVVLPEELERQWWRHVQELLPSVVFASKIIAVQALMLAALHLHNTSHRDACWNLTGTAVRIAFAIGLHRDDIKHTQSPLARELRKQLWWTLYAFEYIQISSYDRPSAIANVITTVSCPNERIVGVPGHCPQGYTHWSQRLVVLLGSACKSLNPGGSGSTADDDDYSAPLLPAAAVLRDLEKWKEALPSHLRLDCVSSTAPSSRRPLFLLHALYCYIEILVSRSALLRRATKLSCRNERPGLHKYPAMSDRCINAGKNLGRLLKTLESINKYNSTTWWDIFFTTTSALVLVVDVICHVKKEYRDSVVESQKLLQDLSEIATRQLQNSRLPGSMWTFCITIIEVSTLVDRFVTSAQSQLNSGSVRPRNTNFEDGERSPTELFYSAPNHTQMQIALSEPALPSCNVCNVKRQGPAQSWGILPSMDGPNGPLQEWYWDDIEAILRGNTVSQ